MDAVSPCSFLNVAKDNRAITVYTNNIPRPPVCIFWPYWGLLVSFSSDFKSLCQILQKHQGYRLRWPNGHSYEDFPHSSVGKNHQPWVTLGKFEFFNSAVDIIPAPLQRPLEDKMKLLM